MENITPMVVSPEGILIPPSISPVEPAVVTSLPNPAHFPSLESSESHAIASVDQSLGHFKAALFNHSFYSKNEQRQVSSIQRVIGLQFEAGPSPVTTTPNLVSSVPLSQGESDKDVE
uniref:Uncharacterized protein n=1 Tax=Cannabis sativa TaxID=3483 RepID=A0A803QBM2_CANSA